MNGRTGTYKTVKYMMNRLSMNLTTSCSTLCVMCSIMYHIVSHTFGSSSSSIVIILYLLSVMYICGHGKCTYSYCMLCDAKTPPYTVLLRHTNHGINVHSHIIGRGGCMQLSLSFHLLCLPILCTALR